VVKEYRAEMSESRHTKTVRHICQRIASVSEPPSGKKKIKNIYWDPVTNELVLEVED